MIHAIHVIPPIHASPSRHFRVADVFPRFAPSLPQSLAGWIAWPPSQSAARFGRFAFRCPHNCARCPIMSPCLCHHYVITTLSICCRYVAISSLYHLSISAGNETSYNFIKYTKSAKTELMLHYVPTYFNTFQCVRPIANASWRHQYYNDMHMHAYCTEIRYHIITHRRRVLPGH